MSEKLRTIWTAFKEAFGFLLIVWASVIMTVIVMRMTTPEVIAKADMAYWGVIGAIITGILIPIHYWFKKRSND